MTCPICRRPDAECDCIRDGSGRPIAPAPKVDPQFEIHRVRIEDEKPGPVSDDELKKRIPPDIQTARFLQQALAGG